MLLQGKVKTAYSHAENNSRAERVEILKIRTAVRQSVQRSVHRELGKPVHAAGFLFLHVFVGSELLYSRGDLNVEIIAGNVVYIRKSVLSRLEAVPEILNGVSHRGNHAHSRDYYSFHNI